LLLVLVGVLHKTLHYNSNASLARNILRVRPWDRHAVIEVAISKVGQMSKYAEIVRPDITVVTSIASEHNRSLGTLEVTRREKAEMVRVLDGKGVAVLNGDDPNVRWMARQTKAKVITFGIGDGNHVRASDIVFDWPNGTHFNLHMNGETHCVSTRLIGIHMVYPILAAAAVAFHEGLGIDHILRAVQKQEPTPRPVAARTFEEWGDSTER